MTREEVDRLAKKWRDGTISDQERMQFEQWYRSFDDSILEIDSNEGEAAMKLRLYRQIADQGAIPTARSVRYPRLSWMRYAAAVALLLLAFLLYWNHQNTFTDLPWIAHVEVRAEGEVRRAILPDGSIIWLRPGATLHYLKTFDQRKVQLTGESLFEVAKIPERPFCVQVGDYVATVLGTSFNIRQAENKKDIEVVVLTGAVAVSRNQPAMLGDAGAGSLTEEVVLLPNQRLTTQHEREHKQPEIVLMQLPEDNAYVQGTSYSMKFDNTPFDEVARRITLKFDIAIEAEDGRYRDCRISADLSDQSLEYTIELVTAALGAEYEMLKDKIILKGGGCL